ACDRRIGGSPPRAPGIGCDWDCAPCSGRRAAPQGRSAGARLKLIWHNEKRPRKGPLHSNTWLSSAQRLVLAGLAGVVLVSPFLGAGGFFRGWPRSGLEERAQRLDARKRSVE